jgi:epsilon-lactone hydrolase
MASWQNFVLSYFLKKKLRSQPVTDDEALIVRLTRRALGKSTLQLPTPKNAQIIPFDEENLRGEWVFWKNQTPNRTLLYLHGGGYFACSPQTHRSITLALAKSLNVRILALDYRLAPEHRFPAALDDAFAAYQYLLKSGVLPQNLLVAGDSAGGGLTLALLLKIRDEQQPLPKAAVCFSPWTDLTATGSSLQTNDATDAMFGHDGIRFGAKIYPGPHNNPTNPYISPLYGDFTGLPPLLIFASQHEVLRDDAVRVAEKARRQGVEVDLQVWDKLPHVWPIFVGILPEARQAINYVAQKLNQPNL